MMPDVDLTVDSTIDGAVSEVVDVSGFDSVSVTIANPGAVGSAQFELQRSTGGWFAFFSSPIQVDASAAVYNAALDGVSMIRLVTTTPDATASLARASITLRKEN